MWVKNLIHLLSFAENNFHQKMLTNFFSVGKPLLKISVLSRLSSVFKHIHWELCILNILTALVVVNGILYFKGFSPSKIKTWHLMKHTVNWCVFCVIIWIKHLKIGEIYPLLRWSTLPLMTRRAKLVDIKSTDSSLCNGCGHPEAA